MRKIGLLALLILVFSILAVIVFSQEEKVYVVKLHYDSDGFTIKEVQVKNGYAPDRKLQQGNFRAELLSEENKVLYGFNFEVPLLLFTDGGQGGRVRGSVIKLNESDFVLVVPFREKSSLRIVDKDKEYVASLSPESLARRLVKMGLWMVAGGIILIAFLIIKKRIDKKEPPNPGKKENPYEMPPGQY